MIMGLQKIASFLLKLINFGPAIYDIKSITRTKCIYRGGHIDETKFIAASTLLRLYHVLMVSRHNKAFHLNERTLRSERHQHRGIMPNQ
jgi:hypothetical protein